MDVDDESQLEFDVANKSLEYDATATIDCGLNSNSASYNDYLIIETEIETPVKLSSGEETTGMLTVKMKKAYTDSSGKAPELTCSVSSNPSSRTEEGKNYKPIYKEIALKGAYPVLDNEKLVPE